MLTIVEDAKPPGSTVLRNVSKQLPVAVCRRADNVRYMSMVVFHEFNALILFLSELDVTID